MQEIIEIGAYRINSYAEVEDTFARFVLPKVNSILSPFCKQLTGISQEQVNRGKSFDKVIQDFQDWALIGEEDYTLISWGNQDQKLFQNDCKLHRVDHTWADGVVNLKDDYIRLHKMLKPLGLKAAVEREGYEFTGEQHRAISDAENLAKIFIKYFSEWPF